MKARYDVLSLLNSGAQSQIFAAFDRVSQARCLLKVGNTVESEAFLLHELKHPYLLLPFDVGKDPDLGTFAAYPEINYTPLPEWLSGHSTEDVTRIALQITEVLAYLHHRGYLYNDFKPQHFLISSRDIRVIDFGLCAPIRQQQSTFSGTFPYISPERLLGRPCDERSDIFAFGVLLLQVFLPLESWNGTPSISNLQNVLKHKKKLTNDWRQIIDSMTSMEASQRPESAVELWNKILSRRGRQHFLFFPPDGVSQPEPDSIDAPVVFFESSSAMNLDRTESRILTRLWKNGFRTFSFNLRRISVEKAFRSLCLGLFQENASGLLPAIQFLQNKTWDRPVALLFRLENIPEEELHHLLLSVSSLAGPSIHFFLFTTDSIRDKMDPSWQNVPIPSISREQRELVIDTCLPANVPAAVKKAIRSKQFDVPEQMIEALHRMFPKYAEPHVPAAARLVTTPAPFEHLQIQEKRILALLAAAGGFLSSDVLQKASRKEIHSLSLFMDRLSAKGYVRRDNHGYHLSVPTVPVLHRFRKTQIRQFAVVLLSVWPRNDRPEDLFLVARHAGNQRLATFLALRSARKAVANHHIEESMDWLWKAYASGATIPRSLLLRMLRFYLLRSKRKRCFLLLHGWKGRFGKSYLWAKLKLDLYFRTNTFDKGCELAESASKRAEKSGRVRTQCYFLLRRAAFLIPRGGYSEAEQILRTVKAHYNSLDPAVQGLFDHYNGLLLHFQGHTLEAIRETRKAWKKSHPFRARSWMNLGTYHLRLGHYDIAEKYLRKAVAIFSKRQDVEQLTFACSNLGVALRHKCRLVEARNYYHQTLYLSDVCGHQSNKAYALDNLAITYSLEGRTRLALLFHKRSATLARTLGLNLLYTRSLNNMAVQLSILGRYTRSISLLQRAARIRRKLKLVPDVAYCYEYLGFTYFLAKKYSKARQYFRLAANIFRENKCKLDAARNELYMDLLATQFHKESPKKISPEEAIQPDTFEYGLQNLVRAARAVVTGTDRAKCRQSLHEAELVFRKLPSLFWLAYTHRIKARSYLRASHYERAALSLQAAADIYQRLGARKIFHDMIKEKLMKAPPDLIDSMMEKLPFQVLLMIKEVLSERNLQQMIDKILKTSLEFTDMERAVLILNESPPRIFKSTSLEETQVREICEISFSATELAGDTRKPFVCPDVSANGYLNQRASIVSNRILSIVCLPLWSDEKLIGYLYLDSREGVEAMATTETALLEIFASVVALVLNTNLALENTLQENEGLRESLGLKQEFPEMIGNSKAMIDVLKQVHPLMQSDIPVLITGETGTGKELIARVLHFCGKRRNGPFIAVNSSAINESLIESELFGHEKGSFTGATELRRGVFEQANEGTLFLDEIGDMQRSMQVKFLRVLQEGEFRRVGGHATLRTNARIILATNKDIASMVAKKEFREDFYYRIRGVQVHVPSLRERREDIPLLATYFLKSAMSAGNKRIRGFSPEAIEALKNFPWPGNIRQLKAEVERILVYIQHEWVGVSDLDPEIQSTAGAPPSGNASRETLREAEKNLILERLAANDWNIVQTARSLGLTRNGLYSKMKLYNIRRS